MHCSLFCAGDCECLQSPYTDHLLCTVPVRPTSSSHSLRMSNFSSVSSFFILFIEVPFLLRICPTSGKFDAFVRRFTTNWMRALVYTILSAIQWASLCTGASSLIAAAVFLILAALFYALAGLRHQEFIGSKTLGGQGIAQMIV